MSLINIIYISGSTRPMSDDDLYEILDQSKRNNAPKDITGILLYRNGYFIQVLEGEENTVMKLYEKIGKDNRHRNVLMIEKAPIEERAFGEWTMGFRNLDKVDPSEHPGYNDLLTKPIDPQFFENDPNQAKRMIMALAKVKKY